MSIHCFETTHSEGGHTVMVTVDDIGITITPSTTWWQWCCESSERVSYLEITGCNAYDTVIVLYIHKDREEPKIVRLYTPDADDMYNMIHLQCQVDSLQRRWSHYLGAPDPCCVCLEGGTMDYLSSACCRTSIHLDCIKAWTHQCNKDGREVTCPHCGEDISRYTR